MCKINKQNILISAGIIIPILWYSIMSLLSNLNIIDFYLGRVIALKSFSPTILISILMITYGVIKSYKANKITTKTNLISLLSIGVIFLFVYVYIFFRSINIIF